MGRGSSGKQGRAPHGPSISDADIVSTEDMISSRTKWPDTIEGTLGAAREFVDKYGETGILQGSFQVATLKGAAAASAIAYYDGSNIAVNSRFTDAQAVADSYAECVASKWHPPLGNRTATEAVAAHELGHAMTDAVGRKLGIYSIDDAATRIVKEARKQTQFRGIVQLERSISEYATTQDAEAVAEAVCDVYCNGNRASSASRAIVSVIDSYLLPKK